MSKKLVALLLALAILFLESIGSAFTTSDVVFAQTPTPELESCFQYYDYGKVQVNLTPEKDTYQAGETMVLQGTIENSNTFPLVNTTLYVQIRRANEDDASFQANGHYLVDEKILAQNISLLAKETKVVNLSLPVDPKYPDGSYKLQFFVFSPNQFYYGGRAFLEEDTAGFTNVAIAGGKKAEIYFDGTSLAVNGTPASVRGLTKQYNPGQIAITVNLKDVRQKSANVTITAKLYSYDDAFPQNLLETSTFELPAGTQIVRKQYVLSSPGAYVAVFQADEPVKTIFRYRFAIKGDRATEVRLADIGVTDYPGLASGKAYVCFHSSAAWKSPPSTIQLTLLDGAKNEIGKKTVSDAFGPEPAAISIPLTGLPDFNDFYVAATVTDTSGKPAKTVEVHYDCLTFAQTLKSIDMSMGKNNLQFLVKNGCGNVVQDQYVDSLRLVKDGQIQRELYNEKLADSMVLSGLPAGSYEAEVKVGSYTNKYQFMVAGEKSTSSNWRIIVVTAVLAIVAVGVVAFVLYRRRKKEVM